MEGCPKCGGQLRYAEGKKDWYCQKCKAYLSRMRQAPAPHGKANAKSPHGSQGKAPPAGGPPAPASAPAPASQPQAAQPPSGQPQAVPNPIWFQNFYRIRKKVLAIANKYWIEDYNGNILGFSKQKLFKLKEDIRIYSDESMAYELFAIKQTQILDIWGTFAVIDTATGQTLGYVKRKWLESSFVRDEYAIHDAYDRLIGSIEEHSGLGLVRKYVPLGWLVPEKMELVLHGQPVAHIRQLFKIIGDIWEMDCSQTPPYLDRRVLLACLILMGMIERDRK